LENKFYLFNTKTTIQYHPFQQKKGKRLMERVCLLILFSVAVLVIAQTPTPCPTCSYPILPSAQYNNGTGVNKTGHKVLVVGASSPKGIGRNVALFYASLGAEVYACARTPRYRVQNYSEFVNAGVTYLYCDVTKPASLALLELQLKTRYGVHKLNMIAVTSGIFYFGDSNEILPHQALQVIETNQLGPANVWYALSDMLKVNASFAFVSSSNAQIPSPFAADYSASKVGLRMKMQVLAWANRNRIVPVKFIDIMPSQANTNIMENALRSVNPKCPSVDAAAFNATSNVLLAGQSGWNVATAFLGTELVAKPGEYTVAHSDGSNALYQQYVFLSGINLRLLPQEATNTYQGFFQGTANDPTTCPH
jgi:NAD(P)-dependent dehydrogenase (short-subunit alcohol dehydrogenase family)